MPETKNGNNIIKVNSVVRIISSKVILQTWLQHQVGVIKIQAL
jgi:hypothetical protein